MELKTIFGFVETVLGAVLLLISIGGFYFVFAFNVPALSFTDVNAADTDAIRIGVNSLVTIVKVILYSFNLSFLFSSILLILDGILKIRDED